MHWNRLTPTHRSATQLVFLPPEKSDTNPDLFSEMPAVMKPLSDPELVQGDVKELLVKMDRAGYSEKEKGDMKQRRRRLQNRQSAKLSAARKQGMYDHLAQSNERLQAQMQALRDRNAELEREAAAARGVADRAMFQAEVYRREIASLSAVLLTQCAAGNDTTRAMAGQHHPRKPPTGTHHNSFDGSIAVGQFEESGDPSDRNSAESYQDSVMRWAE
jgi:hypothetical protein